MMGHAWTKKSSNESLATLAFKRSREGTFFAGVFLGIESPSKKYLAEWSKGDIVDKSKRAVKHLRDNGIMVAGGFIIGNPDDDFEKIEDTYRYAKRLRTDFPAVQVLVPYPKTEIREKLMQDGYVVKPYDYEMYDGGQPVIKTKFLDENQLFHARYKFGKKYLSVRVLNVLKAIIKFRKESSPFFIGSLKLFPEALNTLMFEWLRKLLFSEKKRFDRYVQKVRDLNKFDIE